MTKRIVVERLPYLLCHDNSIVRLPWYRAYCFLVPSCMLVDSLRSGCVSLAYGVGRLLARALRLSAGSFRHCPTSSKSSRTA